MILAKLICSVVSLIAVTSLSSVSRRLLCGNRRQFVRLLSSPDGSTPASIKKLSQIAALNSMATKLRAEAAELEVPPEARNLLHDLWKQPYLNATFNCSLLKVDQQKDISRKLAEAFKTLDTDDDGSISLAELRAGLVVQLKSAITEEQAAKILQRFDLDGDGSIQINEFRGIDAFRLILDKILLEEKNAIIDATQKLVVAQKTAETAAAKANAIQEQVNSLPPTTSDRVVSLLPYLLPLADAIPYSKEFILGNNLQYDNIVFEFAYSIFVIYQTIPFSGLIAFFLLDLLTNNLKLNRLIRFNMQQAIFFDIALIFPGVLGSVVSLMVSQTDFVIPPSLGTVGSTATFLLVSLGIIYSLASSLLGVIPDKIPIISDRAKLRVPTAEQILAGIEEEKEKDDWSLPGESIKNIRKNRQLNRREVEQVEDSAADTDDKKNV